MWKKIRILCLLLVLLVVAVNAWRDQSQDWNKPIIVLLYERRALLALIIPLFAFMAKLRTFAEAERKTEEE